MYISPKSGLALTPTGVRQRATNGKVVVLEDTVGHPTPESILKCRRIYLRVKLSNDDSTGMYHSSHIRVFGRSGVTRGDKLWLMHPESRLWVHCHCPYFLYYCEQALTRIKASSLYDCNPALRVSDPHRQRNPNLTPYFCKHLYAAILALIKLDEGKTKYKEFTNKRNPYDGNYDEKMPPSYTR